MTYHSCIHFRRIFRAGSASRSHGKHAVVTPRFFAAHRRYLIFKGLPVGASRFCTFCPARTGVQYSGISASPGVPVWITAISGTQKRPLPVLFRCAVPQSLPREYLTRMDPSRKDALLRKLVGAPATLSCLFDHATLNKRLKLALDRFLRNIAHHGRNVFYRSLSFRAKDC